MVKRDGGWVEARIIQDKKGQYWAVEEAERQGNRGLVFERVELTDAGLGGDCYKPAES